MLIRGTSLVVKFALTLFIAKFMGFEELGLFGLISAACIACPAFLGLALMPSLSRNAVMQSPSEITQGLRYYVRYTATVYALLVPAAYAGGLITGDFYLASLVWTIILLEHLNQDAYGLLLNLSRPLAANIFHFFRTAGWALLYMGLAWYFPELRTIDALLSGWVAGSALTLLGFIWITRNWPWRSKMPHKTLKSWVSGQFKESRLIYYNTVLETSGTYASHMLVSLFLGLELTGVYVFFFQIISAMSNLLQTGIFSLTKPKLVRAFHTQDPGYRRVWLQCLRNSLILATAMSLTAMPALYIVIVILDKPLLLGWFGVFPLLLLGFVTRMLIHSNDLVFYSQRRDGLNLRLSAFRLAVLTTMAISFTPLVGLWGAVLALLTSDLLTALISYRYVHRALQQST